MSDDPQSLPVKVHKRRGEKFLIWVAVFFVAVVVVYFAMDFSSAHKWKNFQLQMKARGESLDFADFIPKPVPDDQNFALTPIMASSYSNYLDPHGNLVLPPIEVVSNRLDMDIYADNSSTQYPKNYLYGGWYMGKKVDLQAQQLYYRALAKDKFGSNIFQIPPQPGPPAQDILLALSKYNSQVEELRKASEMCYSRFPLNYSSENPFDLMSPHLGALNQCNTMLELRTVAEMANNQPDKAMSDLKLSSRLIESIHDEPLWFFQNERVRMFEWTIQPVWEGLNEHVWSDAAQQAAEFFSRQEEINYTVIQAEIPASAVTATFSGVDGAWVTGGADSFFAEYPALNDATITIPGL